MLLTFGHGTASADELAALIRGAGIESVIDVRAVPKSRRFPHSWEAEMKRWVPELSGATYARDPALGGFRKLHRESPNVALRHPAFRAYADYMESAAFIGALDNLLEHAAQKRTAIMCSETLWWRCHRRLIADAATLLRKVDVQHLMHGGALQPHKPTGGVRVTPDGHLRYDILFQSDT